MEQDRTGDNPEPAATPPARRVRRPAAAARVEASATENTVPSENRIRPAAGRAPRGRNQTGAPVVDAVEQPVIAAPVALSPEPEPVIAEQRSRRRSRGGRGGRGRSTSEQAIVAMSEPSVATGAVARRFDFVDWRAQLAGQNAAGRESAPPAVQSAAIVPTPRIAPVEPTVEIVPQTRRSFNRAPSPATISTVAAPPVRVTAPPAVTVSEPRFPSQPITSGHASDVLTPRPGESNESRFERVFAQQEQLLRQQSEMLATLAASMTSVQASFERLARNNQSAGLPRAGMFVDAPNVVYAAENARVSIDYGRLLDFMGQGRDIVHAIVYAPVTEEAVNNRYDGQRFVTPFLNKGYKMVTKPLKRFPDGTAKGNFDIELAIDIVTMSQRLDVVILMSGDSDFTRLVELVQSRGVRVEVIAFASNVAWELVNMADVFYDIGQYLHEFQST